MDVALRDCPACNAVVMGDEAKCPECGADLPVLPPPPAPPAPTVVTATSRSGGASRENPCPQCGMMLPQGVLRCRDCGSYLTPEIEQAAMARMASRMYAGRSMPGFSLPVPTYAPAESNFSTLADDDDFDLNPDIGFVDTVEEDAGQDIPLAPLEDLGAGSSDLGGETFALKETDDVAEPSLLKPIEETPVIRPDLAEPEEDESDLDFIPVAGVPLEQQAVPAKETKAKPAAAETGIPVTGEAAPPSKVAMPVPSHSETSGGDALLDTALQEQQESAERAKGGRRRRSQSAVLAPGRFLVYCPKGHRIQVQEKHRGRTGRCPNCKTIFFVPAADSSGVTGDGATADAVQGESPEAPAAAPVGYTQWITDVLIHRVVPQKLKLTPGSLVAEGFPADLGISADHILVAVLYKGGGPFRSMQEPKQKATNRKALLEHFASGKALVELKLPEQLSLPVGQLQQLKIVQPTVPGQESLFADIPVFGEGRIGVRLPALDTATEKGYLSLGLSGFRALAECLGEVYGLRDLGAGTNIPLQDELEEHTCHYSESKFQAIPESVWPYYKADTARPAVVLGHRCEKCGLIVSEDSRKKEKVGGKSPDSVAKAKCPKCKQKMGDHQLRGFPEKPVL